MQIKTFLCSAVFCLLTTSLSLAEQSALKAEHIRKAMKSEREKLQSAKFTGYGNFKIAEDSKVLTKGALQWIGEFDKSTDAFLLDRIESIPVNTDFRGGASDKLRIFYCGDREGRYVYHNNVLTNTFVEKLTLEQFPASGLHLFQKLEIEGVGFRNLPDFLKYSHEGDRYFFENSLAASPNTIAVEEIGSEILKLSFLAKQGATFRFELLVNKLQGFTPIRLTVFLNDTIETESQTEWVCIDSIWMPTKLTGSSRSPFLPEGKEPSIENIRFKTQEFGLEFNWSEVNSFRKSEPYDYHAFDLPRGTRVVKDDIAIGYVGIPESDGRYTVKPILGFPQITLLLLVLALTCFIGVVVWRLRSK